MPFPEFEVEPAPPNSRSPIPSVEVHWVEGEHFELSGTSCDTFGYISIAVRPTLGGNIATNDVGYYLLPLSGVDIPIEFPSHPIRPRVASDKALVQWAWYNARPDPDGVYRWQLLLVPVSKHGQPGRAQVICFASDDSCPPRSGIRRRDLTMR